MFALEALPSALGAAAVVPALFYLMSLTFLDGRREPPIVVVFCFLFGAAAILVLRIFEGFMPLSGGDFNGPLAALIQAFVEIAVPEEAIKVIVLVVFARRYITHPMEGVIYGAAVGLGFAAYENLGLLVTLPGAWQQHMVIRNIVTVPLHAVLGIIAGIYIARASAHAAKGARYALIAKDCAAAWLVPVALHGCFDFPLLLARDGAVIGSGAAFLRSTAFIVGVTAIALGARRLYRLAAAQHLKTGPFGAGWPAGFRAWRQHIVGGFAGAAGALMVLIEVQDWVRGETFAFDRHIFILVGASLLASAMFYHRNATLVRKAQLRHVAPSSRA